jgi:integrase
VFFCAFFSSNGRANGRVLAKKKNKRIPANVHVRSDGVWEIRVTFRDPEGKRKTVSELCGEDRSAKAIKDRVAEIKKTIKAIRAGSISPLESKEEKHTVSSFLAYWLAKKKSRIAPRTHQQHENLIAKIPAHLGERLLLEFNSDQLEKHYEELEKQGLVSRAARLQKMLNTAFKWAIEKEILEKNPCAKASAPKETRKFNHTRSMTDKEAKAFLVAAAHHENGLIFELALETGARPEEYLALRWSDLDGERGIVTFRRALVRLTGNPYQFLDLKTKQSLRSVEISERLLNKLVAHKEKQDLMIAERRKKKRKWIDEGLIFCTQTGTPFSSNNLARRDFKDILETARLSKNFIPYDLRHTCATLLLSNGENIKVVSERLGHANITTTLEKYAHALPTMQRSATERLVNLLYEQL